MPIAFTEESFENALIKLMKTKLGYEHVYGPSIERDYAKVVLENVFVSAVNRINKGAHKLAIEAAIKKALTTAQPSLIENNRSFHKMLTEGVEVSYYDGEVKHARIDLIDFGDADNNDFKVVNQFTVVENKNKRPDVVVFINGLPLVVMELKSCSREEADMSSAYRQVRNYLLDIPSLFTYNSLVIISDMVNAKAGTITSGEDRFMAWKSIDGSKEIEQAVQYPTLIKGMFEKSRLLEIIRRFILFQEDNGKTIKILSGYHQFFAVRKAIDSTIVAASETGDGKAGVFWHTQGSGKSLSMVFFSRMILEPLDNPTLVIITDRNDLDEQLYNTFCDSIEYLRQTPKRAESRVHLKTLLKDRQSGGIIFTTMQKFEEDIELLSDRSNIVLLADEAHRSQYGLKAKVDKSGKVSFGMAKYIRNALPKASFIGFTGTPVELLDRSTKEVFGEYIDIYDMTQSVLDGATVPIYYESRTINLKLDENMLAKIDEEYASLEGKAEEYDIAKSKKELASMDSILGAEDTIFELAKDFITHYELREHLIEGKAMVVTYSRPIAVKLYNELLKQKPDWKEKVKIVMTGSNNDPEKWKTLTGDKNQRKQLAKDFKDLSSPFKIAIVVDMWLTGFDVPSLDTMYVYKPMKGHNLMQAIARVNRVYKKKVGGLIVDYVGIANALKRAMKQYTDRDSENYGDNDISKKALPKFMEKLSILRDMFFGLDYEAFFKNDDSIRANLIIEAMDFIIEYEDDKKLFIKNALALRQAESLCRSLLSERLRIESAFFEAIRAGVVKIDNPGKISLREINERISELLKSSIKSKGVINLFKESADFSIFDPEYLQSIANMKQKNLAAELLRKLLEDQIKLHMQLNIVQSELFSERMQKLMNEYKNKQISNIEVIEELLKLAEDMKKAQDEGDALGLSSEEKAFYDALNKPEAARDFYTNEQLKKMTQDLTEMLRKSSTIDWNKKESARAKMRSMIKRLLKKYDYPPGDRKEALNTVLRQAEQWAEAMVG